MTHVWSESFDGYNGMGTGQGLQGRWTLLGDTLSASLVAGAYGGQALQMDSPSIGAQDSGLMAPIFTTALSAWSVGCRLKVASVGSLVIDGTSRRYGNLHFGKGSGQPHFGIRVLPDGAVALGQISQMSFASPSQVFFELDRSQIGIIQSGVNYEFDIICHAISNTVGRVELLIDGDTILDAINIDNMGPTGNTVDTIAIGHPNGTSMIWDDFRVNDVAVALPPMRATQILMTGDTAQKDLTRSAGADNYALIDEVTAAVADYLTSSTPGDRDRYTKQAVATAVGFTPADVHAVQMVLHGLRTDVTIRDVYMGIYDPGTTTDDDGPAYTLRETPGIWHHRLMPTDPHTGVAWTPANFDSYEASLLIG